MAPSRQGLLVALLAVAAAAPYLGGGAVWDDHTLIVGTLVGLDPAGLARLWWQPVGGGEVGAGYYRPLAMTVLALVGRLGMPAVHFVALLAHAASAVLVLRLLSPLRVAVAGAVVFAVHPLSSEVLGWASALPDALALALGLAAAVLAATRPWVAAAALVAGLLCKETALLPLLGAIAAGLRAPRALLPWLGGVAVGGLLRVLAGTGARWALAGKAGLVPLALAWPLSSVAWPVPLTAVRDLRAAPEWVVPVGAVVVVLLLGLAISRGRRPVLAGVALLLSAPLMALPPTLHGYLAAERYAYPGLVGLALVVAAAWPGGRLGVGALAAIAPLMLGLHLQRAPAWRSDTALFTAAVRALPDSSYAWHFLGMAEAQRGRPAAAAHAFLQAVETGHPHPRDRGLRLEMLVRAGQPEQALAWAEAGPRDGLDAETIAWWGRAAAEAGRLEQARALVALLRGPSGWDGPTWVPALAASLGL